MISISKVTIPTTFVTLSTSVVTLSQLDANFTSISTTLNSLIDAVQSSNSIVTNGYYELPGGLKMIWGSADVTSDTIVTIPFHTPFSNAVLFVTTNYRNDTGTSTMTTLTGFAFDRNDNLPNGPVLYFALGY